MYLPRITSLDLLLLPYQSFNLPANSSTQFDVCQHPAPHHVQQRLNLLNQQKIRLLDPVPIIKPQRHHLHQGPLTGITLLAHICATFINELRASLITFPLQLHCITSNTYTQLLVLGLACVIIVIIVFPLSSASSYLIPSPHMLIVTKCSKGSEPSDG